jgi:hypothetical protein
MGMEAFNPFNHSNYRNLAAAATVGAGANAFGHPLAVPTSTSLEYYARNSQFIGRFQI